MTDLRKANDQQQEAQRFQASQASREVAELDPRSVYYVIIAKLEAGLVDEAKAIAAEYKRSK